MLILKSFRFGPEIAYVASCVLDVLKGIRNKTLVGGAKRGEYSLYWAYIRFLRCLEIQACVVPPHMWAGPINRRFARAGHIYTEYIDYFIESATYGFLFTSCKTLENSLVRCAHSFVFQSLTTRE